MRISTNRRVLVCCSIALMLCIGGVGGCDDDDSAADSGAGGGGDATGDATENLLAFQGSGCKFHEAKALRLGRKLYLTEDEASFDGLTCLVWRTEPDDAGLGTLTLDVINYEGPCVTGWRASQAVSDSNGRVEIELENAICAVGDCGWCIYDWSFRVSGVALDTDLSISLSVDEWPDKDCDMNNDQPDNRLTTIPEERLSAGMLCRPTDPDVLVWGSETRRPDEPCAGDEDCSMPELFGCKSRLCRLKEVWVETPIDGGIQ